MSLAAAAQCPTLLDSDSSYVCICVVRSQERVETVGSRQSLPATSARMMLASLTAAACQPERLIRSVEKCDYFEPARVDCDTQVEGQESGIAQDLATLRSICWAYKLDDSHFRLDLCTTLQHWERAVYVYTAEFLEST